MSAIRLPHDLWAKTHAHLFSKPSEHFAFYLATWTESQGSPVFVVKDVLLIDDEEVEVTKTGWVLRNDTLVRVINAAVKSGCALIEAHNHGGALPRFSGTDRHGFRDFVPYVLDSLRGRPYGATVWGDDSVYAEFFAPSGAVGIIDSVLVYGDRLDQVVSRDDDRVGIAHRFDRQAPWFTAAGQRKLGRFRFGIAGLGGTGSPLLQNLVYLGARDFLLVDHDSSDETSMNRLVTAEAADVGTPKVFLARRLARAVAPDARVDTLHKHLQSKRALDALKGVDVLFGCVDNDGARVILNELALAYRIPFFDLGVGIDAERGCVSAAGGRLAVVLPGGPCLYCMNQIDPEEARYWLATEEQREFMRARGYVRGLEVSAPSVVALNAALAACAVNEFSVYVSGLRTVQALSELDLLGTGRTTKAQWLAPIKAAHKAGCPACEVAGTGDGAKLERYQIA